ncbi:replication fork protection component Swi3-domain-containing protein [Mycena latifolia]|nr:replication fork protection component Swi3-domain-containing protein [Mycena latifolia]
MDSIEDIWDAPVAPRSPPPANNKQRLFLQGSDDENDRMPDAPPRRPVEPDVDAMFSDVANLPDERGDDENAPDSTPHPILSSPAHHLDGDEGGGEKSKDGKKPKKKIMRLDEGRLVGDSGFPQLIQDTKNIKIKGKGHEASDLNRLLQVYQFWTHRLYPKTPFKDTVDRVEKLCHSKRMHNMLGVWRDEAHGIVNGKKPGEDDENDGVIDLTADPSIPGPESDEADYASSSSHAATRPPSSAEEEGDFNDFEFDPAAMDASAMINAQQTDSDMEYATSVARNEDDAVVSDTTASRGAAEEDDEDMWALVDEAMNAPGPKTVARDALSDEEEGWNMMDEMSSAAPPAPMPQPKVVSSVEEDYEDMYMNGS